VESINIVAVLVASLATFLIGGIWYSPLMFLNAWLKDMGISESKPGHPVKVFGLAFIYSVVACAVLSTFIEVGSGVIEGALLGLKVGIGFVLCSFGVNYQFANRSFRVLAIDGGYHSIQFIVFGAILGGWVW
jgi:hypothetical protein